MKQKLLSSYIVVVSTSGTRYFSVSGFNGLSTATETVAALVPTAGNFRNLRVKLSAAPDPGSDGGYIITLRRGVGAGAIANTAITVTIVGDNTTGSYTAGDLSVAADDKIAYSIVPTNTPTVAVVVDAIIEFEGTTANESILLQATTALPTTATTRYHPWNCCAYNSVEANLNSIIPCAGTITAFYGRLSAAPGNDDTRVCTIRINGVDQAASVLSFGAADVALNVTGLTLAVSAGDRVNFSMVEADIAAAANGHFGAIFKPTTDGQFPIIQATVNSTMTAGNTYYFLLASSYDRATMEVNSNIADNDYTIESVYGYLSVASGAGQSVVITPRKDVPGAPADVNADFALTMTNTVGPSSDVYSFTPTQFTGYGTKVVLSAAAATTRLAVSYLGYVAAGGSIKVISETVRIVDGLGRRNRSIRILNETERIIEALVRNLRSVKRVNETEQISEGIIRKGWVKKMVNETLQVAEMIVRRLRSIKIRNETINIVEGLVRKLRSTKIINQTVNLVVVATSILKKYVWTIPENLTLIENIIKKTMTISGVVIRFGNDTINLVEVAGRRLRSIRIKSETVNIVEGLIRRDRLVRAIGETVNLVEGLIRRNRVVRLVSEILNIIEGKVTKTFTQTKKIVSDTINIIESTARRLTIIKIVSEVERIVEGIVRRGWAVKIKGETINLIEGMIRRSRAVRIASEVVQIVESLIRRSRVLWRIAETVQIVEGKVTKTFTQLVKLVTDKVNLIEGTVRKTYSQVAKVISETVRLMEVIVKRPRIVKIITDVERLIEGSVRRMWARPIVNETVRIVENISRRMWTRKIINETVRIVEGVYNWTSGKVESWFKFFRANRSHVVFEADGLSLNFKAIKKFLRFRAE